VVRESTKQLEKLVVDSLEEMKAQKITVLDVHELTSVTDTMVVCNGTSSRQVRGIANRVVENAKKENLMPLGVEGEQKGEWVLVDLGDVVVHVMLPTIREFYQLERLWDIPNFKQEEVIGELTPARGA